MRKDTYQRAVLEGRIKGPDWPVVDQNGDYLLAPGQDPSDSLEVTLLSADGTSVRSGAVIYDFRTPNEGAAQAILRTMEDTIATAGQLSLRNALFPKDYDVV